MGLRAAVRSRRPHPSEAALRQDILGSGGSLRPKGPKPVWRAWSNRALRTRAEVELAWNAVRDAGLVPHQDRPKNWDALVALGTILDRVPRRHRVLDMGAAAYAPILRWLYQYGYRSLTGIDLVFAKSTRRGPIRLQPMDLTATTFADASFEAMTCLSVIEHGVDVDAYLAECARLLAPGGVIVTSTDYWPSHIDAAGATAYGHEVHVFDRAEIETFLEAAHRHGLEPVGPVDLDVTDRVVHWDRVGLDYTFLCLVLEKVPSDMAGSLHRLVSRIGLPR